MALRHFAADPLHRRLVFFEPAAAGPGRAEAMLDAFIGFLEPQVLPPEVGRASIAGRPRSAGRRHLAPELIDFVLVALGTK